MKYGGTLFEVQNQLPSALSWWLLILFESRLVIYNYLDGRSHQTQWWNLKGALDSDCAFTHNIITLPRYIIENKILMVNSGVETLTGMSTIIPVTKQHFISFLYKI